MSKLGVIKKKKQKFNLLKVHYVNLQMLVKLRVLYLPPGREFLVTPDPFSIQHDY